MITRGGYAMWKLVFDSSITSLAGSAHDETQVYVGGKEKVMAINLQKKTVVREVIS